MRTELRREQPLAGPAAVGRLPPELKRVVAICPEENASAIWRPLGTIVGPLRRKPRERSALHLERPDVGRRRRDVQHDPPSIRRVARIAVGTPFVAERRARALLIHEHQTSQVVSRRVHERAVVAQGQIARTEAGQ